jgi:hypothetical protein
MYDYDAPTESDRWSCPPGESGEDAAAATDRDEGLPPVRSALVREAQFVDATPTVKEQNVLWAERPSGTPDSDATAKDIGILGRSAARKVREHEAAAVGPERDGSPVRAGVDKALDGEPGTDAPPYEQEVEPLSGNEASEGNEGKDLKRLLSSYLDEQE